MQPPGMLEGLGVTVMSDNRNTIAAIQFQPVQGGYIYRQPNCLVFGPPRFYRVDEAQKSAILAITVARRPILAQVVLWTVFTLMVAAAGAAVWACTGHTEPTAFDGLIWAILTVAQVFVALQLLRWRNLTRLRPLLAGLPLSDEPISKAYLKQAMAQARDQASVRQILLLGVLAVISCTIFSMTFLESVILGKQIAFLQLSMGVVWGALAFVSYRRLMRRVEPSTSLQSQQVRSEAC
jgi:hypothetical protein